MDIVLKNDRCVQTDDRTAAEIEREPELSVLFAVTRILNASRQKPGFVVIYHATHALPAFLREAIRRAGGHVSVGKEELYPLIAAEHLRAEPAPLDGILEDAFSGLARRTAADYHVDLNQAGVAAIELSLAQELERSPDDPVTWWSAVMKLGAVAGQVIRSLNGGKWVDGSTGSLPFTLVTRYQDEDAKINPLGKAIKRFQNGEEDSVVALIDIVCA